MKLRNHSLSLFTIAIACVFAADQSQANGTNPTVVEGQASFATLGNSLNITNSPGAIIKRCSRANSDNGLYPAAVE